MRPGPEGIPQVPTPAICYRYREQRPAGGTAQQSLLARAHPDVEDIAAMKLSRHFPGTLAVLATAGILAIVCTSAATADPKIQINTKFDFGTVAQGSKVDLKYELKNVGDAPLKIGPIQPSCGCTDASTTLEMVPPGKTAAIKAVFNAGGYRGKVTKTIAVQTNDPKNQNVQLVFSGYVQPQVEVMPSNINFGKLAKGKKFSQTVIVKALKPAGFQITGVETHSNIISAGPARKSARVAGAWEIPITVNSANANVGRIFDTITVKTNRESQGITIIRVLGSIVAN